MRTYKLVIHFIGGDKLVLDNLKTEMEREEMLQNIEEQIFSESNIIYRHEYKNVVYNIQCDNITYTELLEN